MMKRKIASLVGLGLSLVALVSTGCPYSTRSGLPEHIRTVEVPVFRNSTKYKGLETKLTEELINRLQDDPQVRPVNGGGDATLEGEIIDVYRDVRRETRGDRPATVRVTVEVRYTFYDNVEQRAIVENATLQSTESSTTAGLFEVDRGEVQATAEDEAVRVLARDMIRRTVGAW